MRTVRMHVSVYCSILYERVVIGNYQSALIYSTLETERFTSAGGVVVTTVDGGVVAVECG